MTHTCAPDSSPKLKSLQDLSIRIKVEVTEETVDHISLWIDGGTKLHHWVIETSNSLHHPLCLVYPITEIPLKGVIPVRVPWRGGGPFSTAEPRMTVWVVASTALLVLWVSTLIPSVPPRLVRVSLWCRGVLLCFFHASTLSCARWAWVAMVCISHSCELQS
jgi:hypothetical protein